MNGGDQLMIKDNIITAISSFLSSENLELYDLNIGGNEAISKIEIFIFSDEELSLSIFERLNYQIQRLIEELGVEKGSYELVLSSPGIERALKTKRHFELALNQEIKIKLSTPPRLSANEKYLSDLQTLKVSDLFKFNLRVIIEPPDFICDFAKLNCGCF